jgi:hypothetical protein
MNSIIKFILVIYGPHDNILHGKNCRKSFKHNECVFGCNNICIYIISVLITLTPGRELNLLLKNFAVLFYYNTITVMIRIPDRPFFEWSFSRHFLGTVFERIENRTGF